MRMLRWDMPARKVPPHPYRDSALLYAGAAGVVVAVTALTGGNVRTAAIVAPAVFVVATAYSWWRWRQRIRAETKAEEE